MNKKYAYVTLVTTNNYVPGIAILYESLRRVKSKYPLICMYNKDISKENLSRLKEIGIELRLVDDIGFPKQILEHNNATNPDLGEVWKSTLTKCRVFDMVEFDKVIFCDADLLILKNIDHCFELPHMTAALDGEYMNLWPGAPHFNSGFFVVKPEKGLMQKVLDFAASGHIEPVIPGQAISDQDILNWYYRDWPNQREKHLSKYYNIFPPHTPACCAQDVLNNAYFVHFVGMKPWYGKEIPEQIGKGKSCVFSLTEDEPTTKLCLELYEVAYGLLHYSNATSAAINWEEADSENEFRYHIAYGALGFFKDLDVCEKYLSKILVAEPDNTKYQQLAKGLVATKKVKKYCKIFRELFLHIYEDTLGKCNSALSYYYILDALKVWYSQNAFTVCNKLLVELPTVFTDEYVDSIIFAMDKDNPGE